MMDPTQDIKIDTSRCYVQPLCPENYNIWSNKMEIISRGKVLWELVSGDEEERQEIASTEHQKYSRRRDV